MDFIEFPHLMDKYVLVMVYVFSHWTKAFFCRQANPYLLEKMIYHRVPEGRRSMSLSSTPCNLEISSVGRDTSRKTHQPRWKGPYQKLQTSPGAAREEALGFT